MEVDSIRERKVDSIREGDDKEEEREHLQCCHVVESQVKLLTEGLALQLLSIHLVCRGHGRTERTETHKTRRTRR